MEVWDLVPQDLVEQVWAGEVTLEGQCQVQKAQPSDARVAAFFSASHPNFQAARAAAEQPTSLLLAIPSIVITKLSI